MPQNKFQVNLNGESLDKMLKQGAAYLYSDSRIVDESIEIQQFINNLITQKGDIKVYSLKTNIDERNDKK